MFQKNSINSKRFTVFQTWFWEDYVFGCAIHWDWRKPQETTRFSVNSRQKKKKKTFVFPFKAEYMRTKVILSQNKKVRSKF